jgi:predicted phosphodiesterase
LTGGGLEFDLKVCSNPKCAKAGVVQPSENFHRNRSRKDGLHHQCKACNCADNRAANARHAAANGSFDIDVDLSQLPAAPPTQAHTRKLEDPFTELVKHTRKPITATDLADRLNLSPGKLKALVAEAQYSGLQIQVANDFVGIKDHSTADVQDAVPVTVGERQCVAALSDTHAGSKYCLRAQLREFVHYAYARGVRDILHPGDWVDGNYRHGVFEVSHSGLEDQVGDLLEILPRLPGLKYHGITGNHDFTYTESTGVDVGRYITNRCKAEGRGDIQFYGDRGAFLRVGGVVVNLWHPKKGSAYATSYGLQKRVESYGSGEKPAILLTGHWHRFCHIYERGIHALACPTFQGGGSAFGKSLGGSPAIGGLILSWETTGHGTLRHFVPEYRAYFEQELPQDIR